MLQDITLSVTIAAHREIKRGRVVCGTCGKRYVYFLLAIASTTQIQALSRDGRGVSAFAQYAIASLARHQHYYYYQYRFRLMSRMTPITRYSHPDVAPPTLSPPTLPPTPNPTPPHVPPRPSHQPRKNPLRPHLLAPPAKQLLRARRCCRFHRLPLFPGATRLLPLWPWRVRTAQQE